jgi:hypothetical protein
MDLQHRLVQKLTSFAKKHLTGFGNAQLLRVNPADECPRSESG